MFILLFYKNYQFPKIVSKGAISLKSLVTKIFGALYPVSLLVLFWVKLVQTSRRQLIGEFTPTRTILTISNLGSDI